MTQAEPWLSVLMPVFNGEEYLAKALDSVALQNDPGIECLIVDGGSSDSTLDIARQYADKITVRIFEKPESANWVWSTNFALEEACAPYSTLLHQDDLWLQGRADAIRDMIAREAAAGLYVTDAHFIDPAGRTVGRLGCPWPAVPRVINRPEALQHLLVQNFVSCPAPVFRTDTARRVSGLDGTLWYTADWDFWIKLVCEGPVLYRDTPFVAFRVHGSSQTVKGSRNVADFRSQLDMVTDRYGSSLGERDGRAKALRAARFSNHLNASLAAKYHGHAVDWWSLAKDGFGLGPMGLSKYLNDSRIVSRTLARVRAGFLKG